MALYRRGTASMDADGTVRGTDTKWKDQLALIRVGATIVFLEQPIKLAVISDIVSDTELKAISTDGQTAADGKYVILLNDSLTVNGLAQNVAETLRYYQSKETEIAGAMDIIASLDMDNLNRIVEEIKANKSAAEAAQNQAELARDASAANRDAASQFATSAEQSKDAAKTSETNANSAKTAAETAKSQAVTAKDQAKGFRDEAEGFANSADASKKVPYAGVTVSAPTGMADMLKRLRDSVKGGFWRVEDISQFPSGETTPFKYGSGVCGGAGDTFFAVNVDWRTSRVKVFSGNNNAINGTSGNVSAIELAKLGANGDVAIGDGGTGASTDYGARANLQVMLEKQASLTTEDLNSLKGDKSGFYYTAASVNATPERNYPVQDAGCLLVQRTGTNDPRSCIQTYTSHSTGRKWIRWLSNGATEAWSKWYEIYNSGSSPTFSGVVTGSAVTAKGDNAEASVRVIADTGGKYSARISVTNNATKRSANLDLSDDGTLSTPHINSVGGIDSQGGMLLHKVPYPAIGFRPNRYTSPDTQLGAFTKFEVSGQDGEVAYVSLSRHYGTGAAEGAMYVMFPNTGGTLALQGTSGINYKKNIVDAKVNEALDRITGQRLVNFVYKDDEQERVRFGIIAEEAELIAPQYIKHHQTPYEDIIDEDGNKIGEKTRDRPSVDVNPIVMDLMGCVQYLNKQVEELKAALAALNKA
ncbi:tail fiber [Escherichia phage AV106]|nr:tail fiber [Escherichia phage AV106]